MYHEADSRILGIHGAEVNVAVFNEHCSFMEVQQLVLIVDVLQKEPFN